MKRLLLFVALSGSLPASGADGGAGVNLPKGDLLQRTARSVEGFWDELQAVNCVETVDQQKLNAAGKTMFRQQTDFDYIAILQLTGNDLIVDESRTMVRSPQHESKLPLLITNGFSTFELIFHPFYQGAYEFSQPETVQVEGKELFQIKFRHVHGARSPTVLKLRQREYPVEWQGTAWIEPASGAVVRVTAGLMESMEDMGLKSLTADVRYASFDFKGEQGSRSETFFSRATSFSTPRCLAMLASSEKSFLICAKSSANQAAASVDFAMGFGARVACASASTRCRPFDPFRKGRISVRVISSRFDNEFSSFLKSPPIITFCDISCANTANSPRVFRSSSLQNSTVSLPRAVSEIGNFSETPIRAMFFRSGLSRTAAASVCSIMSPNGLSNARVSFMIEISRSSLSSVWPLSASSSIASP